MRPILAALLTLILGLACSGPGGDLPVTEPPPTPEVPEVGEPPLPDTGAPRPGRDRPKLGPGRERRARGGPRCLSVAGPITADLRLVFEGSEVVGGTLTFADSKKGTGGVVQPLAGRRQGGVMKASGPLVEGGRRRDVEVEVQREGSTLVMSIDGKRLDGRLTHGPCRGDL